MATGRSIDNPFVELETEKTGKTGFKPGQVNFAVALHSVAIAYG
jgi:hypothetical protein